VAFLFYLVTKYSKTSKYLRTKKDRIKKKSIHFEGLKFLKKGLIQLLHNGKEIWPRNTSVFSHRYRPVREGSFLSQFSNRIQTVEALTGYCLKIPIKENSIVKNKIPKQDAISEMVRRSNCASKNFQLWLHVTKQRKLS